MSGRYIYSPPSDFPDTAPPSPDHQRGASGSGKRNKGGNNAALKEGKSPRLDLAKTLMSALNTTFPTTSLAGNNKLTSDRISKSNKNVTVVATPTDSRGKISGSASSPRQIDVDYRREDEEDFSLLAMNTEDADRANQQNKFKAGGGSVNTERLFAVSSESFELDGVARRNRMARASMRFSDPTLAAASRVGSESFTLRAFQMRDAGGAINNAPSVRGRQSNGSENDLRSRASKGFDNKEESQLVDVRAMQKTVLAWPSDEMEGIILYCEQLREEKIKAEQQLAAIYAERALAAARGVVVATQLDDHGPHRDYKQSHHPHNFGFDKKEIEHTPARSSNRTSDNAEKLEDYFPSFATQVSKADQVFLSQNYSDL